MPVRVADIGMVSRAQRTTKRICKLSPSPDGISVILNQDNPVQSLSDKQIVNIYTDKINNWKLGGLDAPITVVNKAEVALPRTLC